MKIAVSGASGFIGSVICKKLLEQKHTVVALGREPSRVQYMSEFRSFSLEEADKIDLRDVDNVIHTAAYLPKSYDDLTESGACMTGNFVGTKKLLDAARRDKVKSFIHFSSGSIYQCVDELQKVSEDFVIDTSFRATAYLKSKVVGEDHVIKYNKDTFRTVVLRPSSVYGPGLVRGFLPRMVQKIKDGATLTLKDVGNYYVDLVHVDDVASAAIATAMNTCSGVYNIGGNDPETTIQIANMLCFLLNRKDLMLNGVSAKPEKSHAGLDITKATADFGYNPKRLSTHLHQYCASL